VTKSISLLILLTCTLCTLRVSVAQNAQPAHVRPAEAKNHVGEVAIVCGKVVDFKVNKYGIANRGVPVMLDLDQPEPNPVFFVVTFGSKAGGSDEIKAAYKDKNICATGKITLASGKPYIMSADGTNIKVSPEN
jgi:hypothetical protein